MVEVDISGFSAHPRLPTWVSSLQPSLDLEAAEMESGHATPTRFQTKLGQRPQHLVKLKKTAQPRMDLLRQPNLLVVFP